MQTVNTNLRAVAVSCMAVVMLSGCSHKPSSQNSTPTGSSS